jgi:hypothetical protein
MNNFANGSRPDGRQRTFFTLAFLTRAGILTAAVTAVAFVLQVATPIKPLSVLGIGYGDIVVSELQTREQREAHYTESINRATVRPQLDAELQKMETGTILDTNRQAQAGEAATSVTADILCAAGRAYPNTGFQSFCGVGGGVRNHMQAETIDAYNRSRGLPPSGGVETSPGYDPFAPTPEVKSVYRDQIKRLEDLLSNDAVARARQDIPPGDAGTLIYLGKLKALADE